MAEKFKIVFVIPMQMKQELREQVIKDNYGLKGKSQWITEAIYDLLNKENYAQLVSYGEELSNLKKQESMSIDYQLKKKLEEAAIAIRQEYPLLPGLQSKIIRTAILQRLLRKNI